MDKETLDKAQTAFIRARIQLLSTNPFYAHLVMKLPLEWVEDTPGGLSSTDGERMFINPTAFLTLTKQQQVTDLVHEVLHCAAGHLFRRGHREPQKWNIAADIYVDSVLAADGFDLSGPWEQSRAQYVHSLGKGDFNGQVVEQIYEALPDPPKQKQGQPQAGAGFTHPDGCFTEHADGAKKSEAEARWRQAVIEAGQLAGNAAGAWRELVKAAMPKLPFHLKLFEYLNRGMGGDTSWDALNRRYLWQGLYLPCDTKLVMGEVVVAVDTSGSMSSEQLALALGYIRTFRDQHPCKLHIVQCDWNVAAGAGHRVYEEFEPLPTEFEVEGRGGTSFDPPFKLLREKRIEPKVLIYLTDGYGSCSEKRAPCPVLWVILHGDAEFKPPFGEVVQC